MSAGNRRCRRGTWRHLCAACRERRARFQYRGEVRADRQHVLCFQCFRAARERLRAWQIREGLRWTTSAEGLARDAPDPSPVLTKRQVEHRRAMLAHLQRQATSG